MLELKVTLVCFRIIRVQFHCENHCMIRNNERVDLPLLGENWLLYYQISLENMIVRIRNYSLNVLINHLTL